ncbi:FG-GAP-like repeat-containing protein [Planctobacterium marinum]|uniref:FG-GAP repeat protein n=1 Tax=Planctobacterium marinum TaxID=1631968 RepID=A0AA48KSP6_9ALTE|nr:hypothetical protein MACH26_28880 [Planctobacterium marinum]
MSIKYILVTIWICAVYSSSVWALQGEPDSLWRIIALKQNQWQENRSLLSTSSESDTQKKRGPLAASVTLDVELLTRITEGQLYKILTPEGEHTVRVSHKDESTASTTWTLTQDSAQTLPDGKLFISASGISAWLPTPNGLWKLHDNTLQKEMRWAADVSDTKKSPQASVLPLFMPRKNPVLAKELNSEDAAGPAVLKVLFVTSDELEENQISVEEYIEQLLVINNEILTASGINIELQAAAQITVPLEQYSADEILDNLAKSRADDSTYGTIEEELLQEVWQARLDSGADIVSVLVHELPSGLCGKSWLNGDPQQVFSYRFGFNVVAANTRFESGNTQLCSSDTLGHEIGHNLGLDHAAEQDGEGTVFSWGRGYGVDDGFSTVMAYSQAFGDAVAVPFFSSPDLTCLGTSPCGEAGESGADAVRALNNVARRVSLIHNEAVTLPVINAVEMLDDAIQECLLEDAVESQGWVSNEEVERLNCPGADVESLQGMESFPRLQFVSVNHTEDPSLAVFKNLREVIALDFRYSEVEDVTDIAHLSEQLVFLQFFVTNLSCQDQAVLESWQIEQLYLHGDCVELDNDQEDFDADGLSNLRDSDDDNDGIDDIADALPFDASNIGDIDADGVPDEQDAFPYDASEYEDSDNDTIGNNQDPDNDNDGILDELDCAPLDSTMSSGCTSIRSFVAYDYDGDGKADIGVRRSSNALQYIKNSSDDEIQRIELGRDPDDVSVSGDFDGDGIADVAVRRASNKIWYVRPSSGADLMRVNFGLQEEDIPVPADFDGDGITDFAVRRPSSQEWFIRQSSDDRVVRYNFGLQADDIPIPADYDGDGKADIAVRRNANKFWYILSSLSGDILRYQFGLQDEDIAVPADFDGDGITDLAVRRPSEFKWYILRSTDGKIVQVRFGLNRYDIPIVADYDGDGKADVAVRRPGNQMQYVLRSSDLEIDRIKFGLNSEDMPLAAPVSTRFNNQVEFDINGQEEEAAQIRVLSTAEAQSEKLIAP